MAVAVARVARCKHKEQGGSVFAEAGELYFAFFTAIQTIRNLTTSISDNLAPLLSNYPI